MHIAGQGGSTLVHECLNICVGQGGTKGFFLCVYMLRGSQFSCLFVLQ